MSRLLLLMVEMLGITHMGDIESPRQRLAGIRHGNKMNMVAHQAISPDFQTILPTVFLDPPEIFLPVPVVLEDRLAKIPALCDMMRETGRYDSWLSWHDISPLKLIRIGCRGTVRYI